jgi:hypothetical protein
VRQLQQRMRQALPGTQLHHMLHGFNDILLVPAAGSVNLQILSVIDKVD